MVEIMCFYSKNGAILKVFYGFIFRVRCFYGAQLHCQVSSPSPQVESLFDGMVA